jgi:hypothetical protein
MISRQLDRACIRFVGGEPTNPSTPRRDVPNRQLSRVVSRSASSMKQQAALAAGGCSTAIMSRRFGKMNCPITLPHQSPNEAQQSGRERRICPDGTRV